VRSVPVDVARHDRREWSARAETRIRSDLEPVLDRLREVSLNRIADVLIARCPFADIRVSGSRRRSEALCRRAAGERRLIPRALQRVCKGEERSTGGRAVERHRQLTRITLQSRSELEYLAVLWIDARSARCYLASTGDDCCRGRVDGAIALVRERECGRRSEVQILHSVQCHTTCIAASADSVMLPNSRCWRPSEA